MSIELQLIQWSFRKSPLLIKVSMVMERKFFGMAISHGSCSRKTKLVN